MQKIQDVQKFHKTILKRYQNKLDSLVEKGINVDKQSYNQNSTEKQKQLEALQAQNLKFLKNIAQLNEERVNDIKKTN